MIMANIRMRCVYCESRDIADITEVEDNFSPIIDMHCNDCEEDYQLMYSDETDDYEVIGD